MFSQTVEYALRIMVFLADTPNQSLTTRRIAQATHVPIGYLAKVLQNLVKAGLVTSQRGFHGGFTLGKNPTTITLLDVVNTVDPICRIARCPLSLPAHHTQLCTLHRRLDNAIALVQQALAISTLAELNLDAPYCPPRSDCRNSLQKPPPTQDP